MDRKEARAINILLLIVACSLVTAAIAGLMFAYECCLVP